MTSTDAYENIRKLKRINREDELENDEMPKLTFAENVQYKHIMDKVKRANGKGKKYIIVSRKIKSSVKSKLLDEGLEIYYYERKPISLISW